MTLTDNDIRSRLHLGHIHAAADWAARRFRDGLTVAHVELTPGDGTRYQIVISRAYVWKSTAERPKIARDYMVNVIGLGGSYPWAGGQVRADYAGAKWGNDNRWTAVVVTEFLNHFAARRKAAGP